MLWCNFLWGLRNWLHNKAMSGGGGGGGLPIVSVYITLLQGQERKGGESGCTVKFLGYADIAFSIPELPIIQAFM